MTRIRVNAHMIRKNQAGERNPVITVERDGVTTFCHEVSILGPSKVVYRPDDPLTDNTRVWIETTAEVVILS